MGFVGKGGEGGGGLGGKGEGGVRFLPVLADTSELGGAVGIPSAGAHSAPAPAAAPATCYRPARPGHGLCVTPTLCFLSLTCITKVPTIGFAECCNGNKELGAADVCLTGCGRRRAPSCVPTLHTAVRVQTRVWVQL